MRITLLGDVSNTITLAGKVGDHVDFNAGTAQPLLDTGRAAPGWINKSECKKLIANRVDRTVRGEAERLMAKAAKLEASGAKGAKAEAKRIRAKAAAAR